MDLVSIIIPIHNEEKHIKRCLNSVINQSYVNLEILLIIDKSVDSSLRICNEYAIKDNRIKVYSVDYGIPALARNYGIDQSSGDYISFVDADDYIDKDYVKVLYDALINNGCLLSICDYIRIKDKKIIDRSHFGKGKILSSRKFMTDILYNKIVGEGNGKLWHKNLIKYHYREFRYCEDTCFCVENLCGEEISIAYVPKALYYYIVNENSITSKKGAKDLNDTLNVSEHIMQFAQEGHNGYRNGARALCLNFAFFAYLHANKSDNDSVRLRKRCVKWIKKLRTPVLFDPKSSIKTKTACLLSYISMKLVYRIYHIMK